MRNIKKGGLRLRPVPPPSNKIFLTLQQKDCHLFAVFHQDALKNQSLKTLKLQIYELF